MSSPATPSPLNYAPRPPAHQRRVFRRLSVATVLLAFIASGWWWAPPAWRRIQLLYWQHRCMTYAPPANQVVYDSIYGRTNVIPNEWAKFYSTFSPPGFWSKGTAFLHEMRKPNGDRRMVAIDVYEPPAMNFYVEMHARVFTPGTLLHLPTESAGAGSRFEIPYRGMPFLLEAGVPDASDPTHLTIHLRRQDGKNETIDGWLDNNEALNMGLRASSIQK